MRPGEGVAAFARRAGDDGGVPLRRPPRRAAGRAARAAIRPTTPAAVVVRVSWPDEQSCGQRSARLADAIRSTGATRTVLVLVGEALADDPVPRPQPPVRARAFGTSFRLPAAPAPRPAVPAARRDASMNAPLPSSGCTAGRGTAPRPSAALRDGRLLVGAARQHADLARAPACRASRSSCGAASTSWSSCAPTALGGRAAACACWPRAIPGFFGIVRVLGARLGAGRARRAPGAVVDVARLRPGRDPLGRRRGRDLPRAPARVCGRRRRRAQPEGRRAGVAATSRPRRWARRWWTPGARTARRVGVQPPGRGRGGGHAHRPRRVWRRDVRPAVGRGLRGARRGEWRPRPGWRGGSTSPASSIAPGSSPRPRCGPWRSASSALPARRRAVGRGRRQRQRGGRGRPAGARRCGSSPSSATRECVRRIRGQRRGDGGDGGRGCGPCRARQRCPIPTAPSWAAAGIDVLDAVLARLRPGGTVVATYASLTTPWPRPSGSVRSCRSAWAAACRSAPTGSCGSRPRTRCSVGSGAPRVNVLSVVDHRGRPARRRRICRSRRPTAIWRATVRDRWTDVDGFVLCCATGIAVRVVAPLLGGQGHRPGRGVRRRERAVRRRAVRRARGRRQRAWPAKSRRSSEREPVVTTATDAAGIPALDALPGFVAEGDVAGVARGVARRSSRRGSSRHSTGRFRSPLARVRRGS